MKLKINIDYTIFLCNFKRLLILSSLFTYHVRVIWHIGYCRSWFGRLTNFRKILLRIKKDALIKLFHTSNAFTVFNIMVAAHKYGRRSSKLKSTADLASVALWVHFLSLYWHAVAANLLVFNSISLKWHLRHTNIKRGCICCLLSKKKIFFMFCVRQ